MRLLWLFLILAVLVVVPFLIWGDLFTEQFDLEKTVAWYRANKEEADAKP